MNPAMLNPRASMPGRILVALAWCLLPVLAPAQTAEYGLEEVEQQEAQEEAGRGQESGARMDVAPALIPGAYTSLGSARSGVRGGAGQSVMLRYDQHREITPPTDATLRLGPFYANLGISQSIGYRYTRLSGSGVDYLEGSRRGDVREDGNEFPMVSSLTLKNYMIITRKLDLSADINVSYYYYPMETQEDDLRVSLTDEGVFATFSTQFRPSRNSRILLYDDVLYRTDYVDSRGLDDRYGGLEYEYLENALGMDWDWQPSPLDAFSASFSRRDLYPFDDEFEQQESIRYAEMVSYRRSLTPFAAVGLQGTASQSDYKLKDRANVFLYGISAFIGLRITPRLTGNAALGYQVSAYRGQIDSVLDSESSAITASLSLEHTISERYRQQAYWQRMMAESFNGGVDVSDQLGYGLDWSGGLFPGSFSTVYSRIDPRDPGRNGYADWTTSVNLRHQLTRLIRFSLHTAYSMRMNEDAASSGIAGLADVTSDYETFTVDLTSGLMLTRRTALSVYASHAVRMSENPDLEYSRDTIGATLTWSYDF